MNLWSSVSFRAAKVLAMLPPTHPCHQAFSAFKKAEDELADDSEMPIGILSAAMCAWSALPIAEAQRIMNSWAVTPRYPSLNQAAENAALGSTVRRYGVLHVSDRRHSMFSEYFPGDSDPSPVEVRIVEGTSPEDALRHLREAMKIAEVYWQSMVDGVTILRDKVSGEVTRVEPSGLNKKGGQSPVEACEPGQLASLKTAELTAA